MVEITTKEVINILNKLRVKITSPEDMKAIDYVFEKLEIVPERHKYKITCNVVGDLEYVLSTKVYADNEQQACDIGKSNLYNQNPHVKNLEHIKVRKLT